MIDNPRSAPGHGHTTGAAFVEPATAEDPAAAKDRRPRTMAAPYRRVLLVNPPMDAIGAEFMMEDVPLRLEYLAAYIRPHVDFVEIVDMCKEKKPLGFFLRKHKPDLVGVTLNYISVHRTSLLIAAEARRHGAAVIFGGYLATALADELAADPNVDFVARGEGELTLRELVEGRLVSEILGLTYVRAGTLVRNGDRPNIEDLDSLPFPERDRRKYKYHLAWADLSPDGNTAHEMIITSRGCWGRCTFCTEPMMSNGKQRYRSPENVIAEIEQIVARNRGKRLRLMISDPNFGGDKRIMHALCDKLIEYRKRCPTEIALWVTMRTNTVANNPDLVRKLAEAGVDYVFVGMESPKAEDLKVMRKGGGAADKQKLAMQHLRDNGIAVMSCFMTGLPNQTEKDIFEMVDYARSLDLEDAYFAVMCPLPGSQLYDEVKASGQLTEPDHKKWKLWDLVIKHDHLTAEQMREICVRCNSKWYDDLMLPQAYRRWEGNGHRKMRLYDYAAKFGMLIGFFQFFGSNEKEMSRLDTFALVKELPNPRLREFTATHPIDDIFEMRRFLRVMGDQKVQVTLTFSGGREVSWVLEVRDGHVRYIDCTNGHAPDATASIAVDLTRGSLTALSAARHILASNPGWQARVGLARFAAAAASEVGAYLVDRSGQALRQGLRTTLYRVEDGLKRAGTVLTS